MWAGVFLRRHADQRLEVLEALKVGAEYIRGAKLERYHGGTDARGCGTGGWHGAINRLSQQQRGADWPKMMYTALKIADEVPRMILLFEHERLGHLSAPHKTCAHDPAPATPMPDNHLRCMLGRSCRSCPFLMAIDAGDMTAEARDEAKAWTCATHVLLDSPPDLFLEQILWDDRDDAHDRRVARHAMAEYDAGCPPTEMPP
jgi:hypothetical protein